MLGCPPGEGRVCGYRRPIAGCPAGRPAGVRVRPHVSVGVLPGVSAGPGVWRLDYGMGGVASVGGLWFFMRQLGPLMVMTSQWWRKRSRMAVARTSSVKTWPHSLKVLLLVMMTEPFS